MSSSIRPSMNLTRTLYRNSIFFFLFFLVSAVWGFWPGYLSEIFADTDIHHHIHGAVMTVWLGMLISQAYLIRTGNRALHRKIGKLSYILAAAVLISIVVIAHHRVERVVPFGTGDPLLALQLINGVPLFALAFGLAMYYRSDSAAHARFMLCTPLAMTGPIFNRILGNSFAIENPGSVSLPAIDVLLFGLSVWDWKVHQRLVFPVILLANLLLRTVAYLVDETGSWASFTEFFINLPLS